MKANTKQQAIDNLIKVIMISVMKNLFILLLALLTFTTCDDSDRDDTWLQKKKGGRLVEIPVYIGLRPMVNAITTRAENPLDPATENYMNSLRFFEFDQEGFHNRNEDYHEILFSQGHTSYPNISIHDIKFHELSRTIVCVANITPRNVEDLYNTYSGTGTDKEEGHITLDDFKKWMIDVEYQQYDAENPNEKAFFSSVYEGLPVSMPMSAVFEGNPMDFQNKGITFYMGRLLTMLHFTLYFKSEIDKPFGAEFNISDNVDSDIVDFIDSNKTGALIKAPVIAGLRIAGVKKEMILDFDIYAENIGKAFQISDDILDITSNPETLGKSIGKDQEEGKCNYAAVNGMDAAKKELNILTENAIAALEKYGEKAEFFTDLAEKLKERDH